MATDGAMGRYWSLLGLKPGTGLEELDATYYTIVEKWGQVDPDEAETKRRHDLQHAYSVLRRYVASREVTKTGRRQWGSMLWTRVPMGLLLVGTVALALMSMKDLRLKFVQVDTGAIVRLKGSSQPYGTILGFEHSHAFPAGNPGPAYQIRLAETGSILWLSERVVEKGMEEAK